jgi:hypothetical protein
MGLKKDTEYFNSISEYFQLDLRVFSTRSQYLKKEDKEI